MCVRLEAYLSARLSDVVITERTDFEESHTVFVSIGLGRIFADLSPERQMQAIADQYFRHSWDVLSNETQIENN